MKISEITEGVGRITKQNQTHDVGPDEVTKQAAKFGNKVDKDGRPPTLSSKVKGKSTNVLFNLGMTESKAYSESLEEALGEIAPDTEIYVDMDGVLADFFGEWSKSQGVDNWKDIKDPAKAIGDIKGIDDFWLNLPVLPKAKELLGLIKQVKGKYKICTSPLADDPRSDPHKREWVKKNLAFFPPEEVIVTHNKPQFAKQKDNTPNILIDDYGVNINAWEEAGGIGFKYKDYKFNRTAKAIKNKIEDPVEENFADGKKPGRKGLAKRSGVNTKASVSSLRKTAKNSTGEKQRMAHWMANMKAGKAKKEIMFSKKCKQHLQDQNETGVEHMLHAIKIAIKLQLLIPLLLIHAVVPGLFTDKGTTVIQDILKDRKVK